MTVLINGWNSTSYTSIERFYQSVRRVVQHVASLSNCTETGSGRRAMPLSPTPYFYFGLNDISNLVLIKCVQIFRDFILMGFQPGKIKAFNVSGLFARIINQLPFGQGRSEQGEIGVRKD